MNVVLVVSMLISNGDTQLSPTSIKPVICVGEECIIRYFPRRSRLNQTNQLFLEDILLESKEASCSFEGDETTDH